MIHEILIVKFLKSFYNNKKEKRKSLNFHFHGFNRVLPKLISFYIEEIERLIKYENMGLII